MPENEVIRLLKEHLQRGETQGIEIAYRVNGGARSRTYDHAPTRAPYKFR